MKMIKVITMASVMAIALIPVIGFSKCHYGESAISFGEGPYFGPVSCDAGEISSLTVFGPAKTSGTIIRGDLKVMGLFDAMNTEVFGKFSVFGAVKLLSTSLHQDALLATDYALLSNSSLEGVIIKSDTSADLHIDKNSIINGNVKFDSKLRGKVHIENGSIITGQILNGDVAP